MFPLVLPVQLQAKIVENQDGIMPRRSGEIRVEPMVAEPVDGYGCQVPYYIHNSFSEVNSSAFLGHAMPTEQNKTKKRREV